MTSRIGRWMAAHGSETRRGLIVCLLTLVTGVAGAQRGSFNLSTDKTFAPDEQPKIHLYTHNVDALEFRIYRVNDPVKFMTNLKDMHQFGHEEGFDDDEQIDEKTWLEKFHDWKHGLWEEIRDFFRGQFSHEAKQELIRKQSTIERHSRIVSEAEFAQIPLLNRSQLVARWRQLVPSTYFSDNNEIPLKKMDAGLYLLEATDGHLKAYTLVMVSDAALVVRTTSAGIQVFVADRTTGKPMDGFAVTSGVGTKKLADATTGADGVATLPKLADKGEQDNFYVFALKGAEFAASTPSTWSMSGGTTSFAGYAFTERPVYRPGHTVHWKAILREHNGNMLALPHAKTVHVVIKDATDKTMSERDMPINADGDVMGDYVLPADASLGYYALRLGGSGADGEGADVSAGFHVEDYRKPEYRVMVQSKQKRVLEGATVPVTIDSRYFFGEPVANAKVKYRVYHERSFWYGFDDDADDDDASANANADAPDDSSGEDAGSAGDEEAEQTGVLNADGTMTVQVPTRVDDGTKHNDYDYVIEAGVTDAANREITGRGRFAATYSTFRVAVEPMSWMLKPGDPLRFKVTARDYDDKPMSTHVHVQLAYTHWDSGKDVSEPGPAGDVQTGADGTAVGTIALPAKTPYPNVSIVATADAVVAGTRSPSGESSTWIESGSYDFGQMDTTTIVADRKSYQPGDTAHLSLVAEDADFYVLVIVEGDTLQSKEMLHTTGKTLQFDVPIAAASMPNVTVSALFLKNGQLYQATKTLNVPPREQKLTVAIAPSKDQFEPQQQVSYDVKTTDANGKPVSADVSFGVVDEAIYQLHPDESGDMVSTLYPKRYVEANVETSLEYAFSGSAGETSPMLAMRQARYRPQLAQVKPGNEQKPKVRKAFPDTAYWQPSVKTGADGNAHVSFAFPDSLTTWRATVHAITATSQAGSAMNRVLVRKNLLVRMGTPRFVIEGDEVVVPVIAHNYLPQTVTAKLSLDVKGMSVVSGATQSVTLPSKGEATANFRLKATQIGTATLTASAITNVESDALEMSFPVQPAGVKLDVATSGVQAQGTVATAIEFPAGTEAAAHSLRVEVSPSIAGSLFSALSELTSFPYGCTEQTMSSFLPNVIVQDTLKKLNVTGRVNQADLNAKMAAGLARLKDYQHDDGGWGWWKEDDSRVFMTAYVVAGLGQASKVQELDGDSRTMMSNGRDYLRKVLDAHPKMRPELRASVLYALTMAGDTDLKPSFDEEYERRNDLEPEAIAMTGLAMMEAKDARAGEMAKLLDAKAVKGNGTAHWTGSYTPFVDLYYDNDIEATAFSMRLLARVNANDALLPPAAQWLMSEREGGVWWYSTEQTAMVLFGLSDYLAATHELNADFMADVRVNGASVGTHHFTATDVASGASFVVNVDAAHLQGGKNNVQIVKTGGNGRVYWSAVGTYFSTSKKEYQAGTIDLNLTRDYFTLVPVQKDGKIVYSLKPFNGTAQIGDVLAVHEAIGGSPEKYLLIEDPIPAGAEFVTNQDSYTIDQKPGEWWDGWFTRREFHDDHAAFFAEDFEKRQEIFYLIRIVNPGSFTVSPASVEPMYQPNIHATTDAFHIDVPAPAMQGGAR